VIPALLQQLRQTDVSVQDMVVRIQRDTVLTTEVLRLARSPRYASAQSVQSLETAIAVIGTAGLQAAIAKVILKPLFSAHSGGLAAQAGERLWMHADHQAQHASTLTEAAGLDRFDGFLVGLLHGAGRTGVLRLLDMQHVAPEWPCSQAFDHAFQQASHQLFDRLLQEWAISPSLTALGQAIASQPSAAEPGTLAGIALESERLATAALLSTH
jgi:HD-like signal output (HDOD) protein